MISKIGFYEEISVNYWDYDSRKRHERKILNNVEVLLGEKSVVFVGEKEMFMIPLRRLISLLGWKKDNKGEQNE